MFNPIEILSSQQTYAADSATIKSGTPSINLMENAGCTIVDTITQRFFKQPTLVLCGPGNNGGDGFVVARRLAQLGWEVDVKIFDKKKQFKNDAKTAYSKYTGNITALDSNFSKKYGLIIDAIFGVGLSRPIDGELAEIIPIINDSGAKIIAVDMPTGVNADTGQIMGVAIKANLTVTFARKKIGQVLLPGKQYCGETIVTDIGIKDQFIKCQNIKIYENLPILWLQKFPHYDISAHKYSYGHAVVNSGRANQSGAAKLSSIAALRMGAGLVTISCPIESKEIYAANALSVMTYPCDNIEEFKNFLADLRKNVILLGPGNGVNERTKDFTIAAIESGKKVVLDADAITVFADQPDDLFRIIKQDIVMAPHQGEFNRIFHNKANTKIDLVQAATKESQATILLKGSDTVIASPSGECSVNTNAPAWLATAGSGDVLSGIITGLMARGMTGFDAACAGAWIHAEAANIFGPGMISSDIVDMLPTVLQTLLKISSVNGLGINKRSAIIN